jgi:glycerophosphoryl diester phosphodiesterase
MAHSYAFEVQGHRGSRAVRPENTIPGFSAAIEAGANVLEFDVLVTADDELIIHHDFFVNKDLCSYLDGTSLQDSHPIRSLTLSEIKKLDGGAKINPEFPTQIQVPGTQIPTLQELFEFLQNSSHPNAKTVRLNLEIKRDPRYPEWTLSPSELAKKIVKQVKVNGFTDRIYYSSFDPEVLLAIRKEDPNATVGFIFSADSLQVARLLRPDADRDFLVKIASYLQAKVLSPEHSLLSSKQDVIALQKQGFRVIPWTVNDPARWKELIEMGVDGIISDDPKGLIDFCQQYSPSS